MAKFALPIKSTYVPDWGVWECLREFIQNAKDEEDDNGSEMLVEHSDDTLVIRNAGADMDRSVLLLGQTSKARRRDLRGQFGEGLNLAMLAGIRSGMEITIYTQTERWSASLEPSSEYAGEECLVVHSRRLPKRRSGVEVRIKGLPAEEWEEMKGRFLFMSNIPDHKIIRVHGRGALLLDKQYKGKVFAKGVFVSTLKGFEYGYDLDQVTLDRDRRMVNIWDVQYELGVLFKEAVSRRPEALKAEVYRMLRDGSEDVRGMHYHVQKGSDVLSLLKSAFIDEHGDNAVPVSSMSESAKVEYAGRRGIVVPESLRKMLQAEMGTPDEIVQQGLRDVVETYAWSDLSETERENLSLAAAAFDKGMGNIQGSSLSAIEIVTFRDPSIMGTCNMDDGSIRISRSVLGSMLSTLRTIVHESAHASSGAGDGDPAHTSAVEEMWMKLWASK